MQKKIFTVLMVTVLAWMTACSSNPASIRSNVPDFVRKPPKSNDIYYGIGSAKMDTTNMSLTIAVNRARVSVAQQITSQVKSMIDDYNAQIEGDPKSAEKFVQSVARTLSEAKLNACEIEQQVQTPDGTWWVLVAMKKADANKEAESNINREKANYAEFKNWNAQKEMDAAFEKQASKNPPIIEK